VPLDLAGILLEAGAVSEEQMERALAHQRQMSGALDTALLELALVPRRELAGYLSRASGLPPPPSGEFEPDPRARRVFPARVAERHGLAPFRLEGKELSLLATYPVDLAALDEISFMLSLRLVPHVAPEWQVRTLLVNVYGGTLSERFAALAQGASEPPGAPEEPAPLTPEPAAPAQAIEPPGAPEEPAPVAPEPAAPAQAIEPPGAPEEPAPVAPEPAAPAQAGAPPGAPEEPAPLILDQPVVSASQEVASPEGTAPAAEPELASLEATAPAAEPAPPEEALVTAEDDFDIWFEEDVPIEESAAGAPAAAPTAAPAAAPSAQDRPPASPSSTSGASPPRPPTATEPAATEPETWTSSGPPDAPPHWTRQEALSALEAARSRDEVVTVALRYLRDFFEASAVFAVTRSQLAGHDGMGWPGARELCRRIRLAPRDAPMLAAVLATKAPFLGAVAPERGNDDLLASLGRRSPRLALAYPVLLRDRPVCILYADNGEKPVSPRRLGDLLLVMGSLGGALERVLRDAKRSRAPAAQSLAGASEAAAAPAAAPSAQNRPPASPAAAPSAQNRPPASPSLSSGASPPRPPIPIPIPDPTSTAREPAPSAPVPEALAVPSPFDVAEAVRRLCLTPAGSDARKLLLARIVRHGPDAAAALRDVFPGPVDASGGDAELTAIEERGPVLSALHALGTVAAPFLVALLLDPVRERRRWAALLLGRIGDPAAFLPLAETALDADPELTAAAIAALAGVRRHPDFRPVLERLRRELAMAEADRPARAAHALGALGDAEAIPLLVQALEASGPVAEASARALTLLTARQFGHDTAAWISWWKAHRSARRSDWLFESLVDPDPAVRSAAAAALRLAASPKPPLDYRADASPREREDAARAWRAWWEEQRLET
jgi:hypothetical protein